MTDAARERRIEYKRYLKSPQWKLLRAQARQRANRKCEMCGGPPDHVHHIKYPKVFRNDHIDNLIVVCEPCHMKLHGVRREQTKRAPTPLGKVRAKAAKILKPVFVWLYRDQLWNADMSIEIDRLTARVEELEHQKIGGL